MGYLQKYLDDAETKAKIKLELLEGYEHLFEYQVKTFKKDAENNRFVAGMVGAYEIVVNNIRNDIRQVNEKLKEEQKNYREV